MLASANRITSGDDYKAVVRRGKRVVGPHLVTYLRANSDPTPVRFGFIVAKNVGNAVNRNLIRRRLKSASFGLLSTVRPGTDVVIRALPSANTASWATLQAEIAVALQKVPSREMVASPK